MATANHHILNKQEAWNTGVAEVNIPIDYSAHQFNFTRKWFRNRNQCTFSTFLPQKFDGTRPVRMIQIGVFEGMDLVWQLQHILKHPESVAIAIDPWLVTTKIDQGGMDGVYERALGNLQPYREKVRVYRGLSGVILPVACEAQHLFGVPAGQFDYCIIDGDHMADAVIQDAKCCLEMVKPGGWLVFDDVRCNHPKPGQVEDGLREFLAMHGRSVRQAWSHRFCECYERVA